MAIMKFSLFAAVSSGFQSICTNRKINRLCYFFSGWRGGGGEKQRDYFYRKSIIGLRVHIYRRNDRSTKIDDISCSKSDFVTSLFICSKIDSDAQFAIAYLNEVSAR